MDVVLVVLVGDGVDGGLIGDVGLVGVGLVNDSGLFEDSGLI